MIVKLLTEHHLECLSLKGGCRGLSSSTLVKMSIFWKSHAAAHICHNSAKSKTSPSGKLFFKKVKKVSFYDDRNRRHYLCEDGIENPTLSIIVCCRQAKW